MHFLLGLSLWAIWIRSSIAGYALTDDYSGHNFFPQFEAFTEPDPTEGFVQYHSYAVAIDSKKVGTVANYNNASYMGVDAQSETTTGRSSVRITSKKSYNHGLFIADIAHMPGGICGVWPAFWMVGPNWPNDGEIDIMEGVNSQESNRMTLHTGADCQINKDGFSGTTHTTNCNNNAPGQDKNAGCGVSSQSDKSYGAGFNAAGGGAFATQWNSSAIAIWFWQRSSIPSDVASGHPNPSTWGMPMSLFAGDCNIDQHFRDLQIVFDTTFCGVWAGRVWDQSPCRAKADSCEAYVGQNPSAFQDAYWLVNSVKVYEQSS